MKNQKGQSLVEMALGLVVLVMVMCAVLDLGRYFFTSVSVEDAAGEAALYYAINDNCPYDAVIDGKPVGNNGIEDGCEPPDNALWRAQNSGNNNINWDKANVKLSKVYSEACLCYYAHAEITYSFRFITPVFSAILGDNEITITSHAAEVVMIQ